MDLYKVKTLQLFFTGVKKHNYLKLILGDVFSDHRTEKKWDEKELQNKINIALFNVTYLYEYK